MDSAAPYPAAAVVNSNGSNILNMWRMFEFFLYWKISFISLIFTFTAIITHRSDYVVETVNVFSLKAEESIRKINFSYTTIKKMLDFFGECKYLFRHIKVTEFNLLQ